MHTINLNHTMTQEAAQAAIYGAVTANRPGRGLPTRVHLNGFSAVKFAAVAATLPAGWRVAQESHNAFVLYPPGIKPGPSSTLTVFSGNLDFNDGLAADAHDAAALMRHGVQAFLGQELTSTNRPVTELRKLFPGWHVTQGKSGPKAMTGVAVDPRFHSLGGGHVLGLPHIPGVKLNQRDIAWHDVLLAGHTVRLMSVHLPPHRFHQVWPLYAARLIAFKATSPYPVIIGGDFNSSLSGPEVRHLAAVMGLRTTGSGIDVIMYSPKLRAVSTSTIGNAATDSDHPFPGATFQWAA